MVCCNTHFSQRDIHCLVKWFTNTISSIKTNENAFQFTSLLIDFRRKRWMISPLMKDYFYQWNLCDSKISLNNNLILWIFSVAIFGHKLPLIYEEYFRWNISPSLSFSRCNKWLLRIFLVFTAHFCNNKFYCVICIIVFIAASLWASKHACVKKHWKQFKLFTRTSMPSY